MGCEHAMRIPTRRIISNGVLTVSLQCQECGSGQARPLRDYKVNELPDFDESIKVRYEQRLKEKWQAEAAKFQMEQVTHSGQWWQRYNEYLHSDEWEEVRRVVLERDPICQKCFREQSLQAHHLSYATYNKHGFTFPAECVGVCESCHETIHTREGQ